MIHFAYPNVYHGEPFAGCGRFCPAEEKPHDGYEPVNHDSTADLEKLRPLIVDEIAKDTRAQPQIHIYEKRDQNDDYLGISKQLAYLLVYIYRVRRLKLAVTHDIWCTGSIREVKANYPALVDLEQETFGLKLQAFLAEDNPDWLFIVPAANITPEARRLCETHGAQLHDLDTFEQTEYAQQPLPRKTIVTVRPDKDELYRLVSLIFHPGDNPYKGLNAFQEDDADRFFGRTELIDFLWTKYQQCQTNQLLPRLLILTGPSGSGKSSLLQAGVAAKLRQQQIPSIIFQPGQHPLDTLHDTLAEQDNQRRALGNEPLAILIDQFEDLYFECRDADEQEAFITNLLTISTDPELSITIILSLRSSFQDRLFEQFAPAIAPQRMLTHHAVFVPSMDSLALRQVICEPAKYAGVIWNEQLVYELIKQTEQHQPGALPLLEVALDSLWEAAKEAPPVSPEATLAELNAKGGLSAALAIKAENAVRGFSVDEELLRRVFLALVRLDEEQRYVRRRNVPYSNIPAYHQAPDQVRMIFRHFSGNAARFVTLASANHEPTVEIIHDSLIASWEKLRKWTADDYEFQLWRQRLQTALREWEQSQRDENALLRGARLSEAENWLNARTDDLLEEESQFIESGLALKNREIAAVEAQRQRELATERQHAKRLRTRLIWAVIALIVAVGAGAMAYIGFERANFERETAEIEAQANQASAQYQSGGGEIDALLTAMQSGQRLHTLVRSNQRTFLKLTAADWKLLNFAQIFSNAQKEYPTIQPLSVLHTILYNIRERNSIEFNDYLIDATFSPDGSRIASLGHDRLIRIFDQTGKELSQWRAYDVVKPVIGKIRFMPDGKQLFTGLVSNTSDLRKQPVYFINALDMWEVSGKKITSFTFSSATTNFDFSIHPQKSLLACAIDSKIELYDLSGNKRDEIDLRPLDLQSPNAIFNASFSPDGSQLVMGDYRGEIICYNLDTQQIKKFKAFEIGTYQVGFAPNGKTIFVQGLNIDHVPAKVIRPMSTSMFTKLFDCSGKQLDQFYAGTLISHISNKNILFTPDSNTLILPTGQTNSIVSFRNIAGEGFDSLHAHTAPINSIQLNADGTQLVTTSQDKTLRLWNRSKKSLIEREYDFRDGNGIVKMAFSSDSEHIIAVDMDDAFKVWDRTGGGHEFNSELRSNLLTFFTLDGNHIVQIQSHNNSIIASRLDLTGKQIDQIVLPSMDSMLVNPKTEGSFPGVFFSSSQNGDIMITCSRSYTRLWNFSTQSVITIKAPHYEFLNDFYYVRISPDGKYALTISSDDEIGRIWDFSGKPIVSLDAPDPNDTIEVVHPGIGINPNRALKRILLVFSDSSAMKAGLRAGDIIQAIDGKTTTGMTYEEATNMLRGEHGTQVSLTIERDATYPNKNFDVTLTRENVKIPNNWAKYQSYNFAEFTPDSQHIITYAWKGNNLSVWDITGRVIAEIQTTDSITNLDISPNSQYVAIRELSNQVELYSLPDLRLLQTFKGFSHAMSSDFSPDSQQIAIGTQEGTVVLFNVNSNREIRKWQVSSGVISHVAFSPDGEWLAADDVQNTIKLFSAGRNLDSLLAQGCRYLRDYFVTHPKAQAQLGVCQEPSVQSEMAKEEERIKQKADAANQPTSNQIHVSEEEIRASHIFVTVKPDASQTEKDAARRKIEKILARLNTGDDFAELAAQYSEDPDTKERGGDLGFFPRGMMVKPLEDAAFRLKEGEVSDIVETSEGYHLITLTGRRSGSE